VKNTTLHAASKPFARVILAPGAGAGRKHAWMIAYAKGLAARGLETITFDFAYMAAGRKRPDPAGKLEDRWIEVAEEFASPLPLIIGGKSMGGRIASQVVARGAVSPRALVFFGYPLHPPDRPEVRRDAHLPAIRVPMLFVQGSRDDFGGEDELRPLVKRLPTAQLRIVQGGDHSLQVRKMDGVPQADVDRAVLDDVTAFVRSVSGV
jgi:predicted alpha/beta-hydrolase family hydrolase